MSSSSRKSVRGRVSLSVAAAVAATFAVSAQAAQHVWVPRVSVLAEAYSNRDLLPDDLKSSSHAYGIALDGIWGIGTPRSNTTFRPEITWRDYPDQPNAEDLEGGLEFAHQYRGLKSEFGLFGRVQYADVYNAELVDPRFNELDPTAPPIPGTGRIENVGETRTMYEVRPEYSFDLSQRTSLSVRGGWQSFDYSSDTLIGRNDYDYYNLGLFPSWKTGLRSEVELGAYVSHYETGDGNNESDLLGASLGLSYEWSETVNAQFALLVERTDTTQLLPAFEEETTSLGGRLTLSRRGPVHDLRLMLAHLVTPSGAGGMYKSDQLQLQYDRRLSERTTFRSAALYLRERALTATLVGSDVDYANVELALRRNVTRTWFVDGGYRYVWREYDQAPSDAENHTLFLNVGYQGLDPRQR